MHKEFKTSSFLSVLSTHVLCTIDDFLLIDHVLRKYGYVKDEINSHKTS